MLLKENSLIDIITTSNDNLLIVTKGNDNNINLDTNITKLVDNKVEQANREMPWVIANKSKNKGEYDLKTELGDYNGYVYNGKIITGRGAGNILFGRNAGNSIFGGLYIIPSGGYHMISNDVNYFESLIKNGNVFNFGETNEMRKYYENGRNEQFNKNLDDILGR